jgi:hypothetical protein
MIDELLDHMEAHPEYRFFNLDGQTIVIEDYLELRPENEARLRALIECGRIVIGPWLMQPDEFLPSGESHIRSLQRGIRFAERLGGSLMVGHCADQFGHIAQMPQIMSQLGITSACLWRGVPDSIPGWSFWWEAPDGTRLPVLYLRESYSSGWRLPKDTDELLERVRKQEQGRRDNEPALLMNGTDHSRMEKHVPAVLSAAEGRGYRFHLGTLADYERAQLAAGVDDVVHHGELRSPDRSNVLVGVLSSRMNIKQRDFAVSSMLERIAGPLELLAHRHGGPDGLPALKHAWTLQLENSPHDSICGCSVDQVHREMLPRYDRAEQLARQVARESLWHLAKRIHVPEPGGLLVFRPVQDQPQVIECDVPAEWTRYDALLGPAGEVVPFHLQRHERQGGDLLQHDTVSPRGALRHLDFLREQRYDVHAIEEMSWAIVGRHLTVETRVGDALNAVDADGSRDAVRAAVRAGEADTAEVRVTRATTARLRAVLPPADAIGVQVLKPAAGTPRVTWDGPTDARYRLRLTRRGATVRERRGGLAIGPVTLVSEGDRGDEYNADIVPAPAFARWRGRRDAPLEVDNLSRRSTAAGDLVVPAGLTRDRKRRRRTRVIMPVLMRFDSWRGLPWLPITITIENRALDHRVRVLFPLPFDVDTAITEGHFHVADRPLEPPAWNGRSAELPPTTFPQKTFVAFEHEGRGVAIFNRGLPEGEVVRDRDGRPAYAVTLLRCVGWLSRNDLVSRRGGAGPRIQTPDAQMQGLHTFELALMTYRGDWRSAGVLEAAHAFAHPPFAGTTNAHPGQLESAVPLVRLGEHTILSTAGRDEVDERPFLRTWTTSAAAQSPGSGILPPLEPVDLGGRPAPAPRPRPWTIQTAKAPAP